ncbi:MAG: YfiT family bacillithiol transferase [Chitinophagales bacterium]
MMNEKDLNKLRFPIGEFEKPAIISAEQIKIWISDIEQFPKKLCKLIENLPNEALNWKYRPDGWTIKQVVHHCADSHINSFCRFKLSLTEDTPIIKPYFEGKWAELPDVIEADINDSLQIIKGLHSRWTILLKALQENDFEKTFIHPEHGKHFSIAENIGVYAWHSNHHLTHVKQAIQFRGEF